MPKIIFIGAGSTVFAKHLLVDILSYPELAQSEIVPHDSNAERLRTSEIVANRIAEQLGIRPTISMTLDRRRALNGADYAIWHSTCASSADAKTSIPAGARSPSGARTRRTPVCATRCCGGWATSSPRAASTSATMCPGSSSATAPT